MKERSLAAWIGGLHDELPQREAQLIYATAALAKSGGTNFEEQARAAEASAQAYRLLVAMRNELQEKDREMGAVRSESEDLRKRLSATEAELKRKDAENDRLAAELGAARSSTESAPVIARVERGVHETAADLADGLKAAREEAILQQQERVFTVDFEKRTFTASSAAAVSMPLDPKLEMRLLTAESELVGESEGGIRFFPDGSSTGGRIELELLGERAVVNVQWSTGAVTLER